MTLLQEKKQIKALIDTIDDHAALRIVSEFLHVVTRNKLYPQSENEFYSALQESAQAAQNGDVIPHSEMLNFLRSGRA